MKTRNLLRIVLTGWLIFLAGTLSAGHLRNHATLPLHESRHNKGGYNLRSLNEEPDRGPLIKADNTTDQEPLLYISPKRKLQTPTTSNDTRLIDSETLRARTGERKPHAFHKTMELFGFVLVQTKDEKVAIRAITPSRVGNGALSYSLGTSNYNGPFLHAKNQTIVLPMGLDQQMFDLVRKAANRKIHILSEEDKEFLQKRTYAVIQIHNINTLLMFTEKGELLMGDQTERVLILGDVKSWQNTTKRKPSYLGHREGKLYELKEQPSPLKVHPGSRGKLTHSMMIPAMQSSSKPASKRTKTTKNHNRKRRPMAAFPN